MGQIPHCLTRLSLMLLLRMYLSRTMQNPSQRSVQSCYWFCIRSPKWLGHPPFSWICRAWGVNSNVTRIPSQLLLPNCRTPWITTTSFKAPQQKAWNSLWDLNTTHHTGTGCFIPGHTHHDSVWTFNTLLGIIPPAQAKGEKAEKGSFGGSKGM